MKKLIALFVFMLTFCALSGTAGAEKALTEYEILHGVEWNGGSADEKKLLISGAVNISEDMTLKSKELTIEKNAVLEITNGAELVLTNIEMFVETGGNIIVSDGKLVLDNGELTNNGLVVIGENGTLNVKRGIFRSLAEGGIINNGTITCFDNAKDMNKIFAGIKKYDSRFNLIDYSVRIDITTKKQGKFSAEYCADRIRTDYSYSAELVRNKKTTIEHTPTSLSDVYDTNRRNKVLDRIHAYEASHNRPEEFEDGWQRESYYLYSYETEELIAESIWLYAASCDCEDHEYSIFVGTMSEVIEP